MLMNLISNENSNKLGDSCEKQISVKCFFILGFTIRNAETILEMIDRFFYIYMDLSPLGGLVDNFSQLYCTINLEEIFCF